MEDQEDIIGRKFGVWTVIGLAQESKYEKIWLCQCDNGHHHRMGLSRLNDPYSTKSCQHCIRIKYNRCENALSDPRRRKTFQAWSNMKGRCNNKNHPEYKNYGGRGINVYQEWQNDFPSFYNYVSKLPHYGEPGRSIDRINNNSGYFPGNLRWATQKEQCQNRRKRKPLRNE